jgi:integrase/recombinase XerD
MVQNTYKGKCVAERGVAIDKKQSSAIDISIQEFLNYLKSHKYSVQTILSYRLTLNRFHSFLTAHDIHRVQDVTLRDLENFSLLLTDDGLASKSLNTYLINLRLFYRYLEHTLQVFVNPAENLVIPKPGFKLQHVPSEEDMKKLLLEPDVTTPAGIRDRALLEILYSTGVRLEELVGINLFDVNMKQKIIKVLGKGNKERMVPMGKQATYWLNKYIKEVRKPFVRTRVDEHALFVGSQQGKRISPQTVSVLVREYSKQAEITPLTTHAVRRACATHLLRGGAHPAQIQKLLGHATMKALRSYLKLTIEDIKKMHKKGKPGK